MLEYLGHTYTHEPLTKCCLLLTGFAGAAAARTAEKMMSCLRSLSVCAQVLLQLLRVPTMSPALSQVVASLHCGAVG